MDSLPIFVRATGRPVILLGEGEAAAAKRRLLERAGAKVVDESADAALAVVAIEDAGEAQAAVARLRARGVLVNVVDRPDLCDWTTPAIVDRAPVLVAIGTSGVSAGLAKAVRQRIEALLPAGLGRLADALFAARAELRARFPDAGDRRRAIDAALAPGGALDPLRPFERMPDWRDAPASARVERVAVRSPDPDELTLRAARLLGEADLVRHPPDMPPAILARVRADAARTTGDEPGAGLVVELHWATD